MAIASARPAAHLVMSPAPMEERLVIQDPVVVEESAVVIREPVVVEEPGPQPAGEVEPETVQV